MELRVVLFLQIIWSSASENSSADTAVVWRVSVLEHHFLCLPCGPGLVLNQDFSWTHGVQEVLPHHQDQDPDQDQDQWRFSVGPNGTLCIFRLQNSDCDLFSVQTGWTLLLPCSSSSSSKPRQRWFWRKSRSRSEFGSKSRWEPILSRSRSGAVVLEKRDPRLGFEHGALRISSVQIQDSGEYRCNADSLGTLQVLESKPTFDPPHSSSLTPETSGSDVVNKKTKEKNSASGGGESGSDGSGDFFCVFVPSQSKVSQTPKQSETESGVDGAAAVDLRPQTRRARRAELQSAEGEEPDQSLIHYASLGRPTWKHPPVLTSGGSEEHSVIYSTICTK
ncbi:hypothetical protein WMY93_003216 [Mugilogobius chulae]|uniref:Ig-like domain-containing protein n=1 Tax=Mugilogobius chulae TaxID=88201 RepID=A0AAW0Q487_9GOBI